MALNPKLSVLLPAMCGYEKIRPALDSWIAQASLSQLEILLLVPSAMLLTQEQMENLPPRCVVVPVGAADLHEARAIGIEQATGEYVVMAEDHCLPDATWSEAVLGRIEEGWDAIGSALRPGSRVNCWCEGSFLIGYGEWMMPVDGGPTQVLCGWNGTIRTELLRQFGDELASELLVGALMMQKLEKQNCRFYVEPGAKMRHFDPVTCSYNLFILLLVGMGFGAIRAEAWGWPMRLAYAFAFPVVALLHLKRAWVHDGRAGRACRLRRSALLAAAVLACVWGVGEAAGTILGRRRITPYLWKTEVKPVTSEMIVQSDRDEARYGESYQTMLRQAG